MPKENITNQSPDKVPEHPLTNTTWQNLLRKTTVLSRQDGPNFIHERADSTYDLFDSAIAKGLDPSERIIKYNLMQDLPTASEDFSANFSGETYDREAAGVDLKGRLIVARVSVGIYPKDFNNVSTESETDTEFYLTDKREVYTRSKLWRPLGVENDEPNPELAYAMREKGIPHNLVTLYKSAPDEKNIVSEEVLLDETNGRKLLRAINHAITS